MKHTKQILCLIMACNLLLLAASCGKSAGNANGQTANGRYVEYDITPPVEGRFASFLKQDGTIVCFDEGLRTRYESADGGDSWNSFPGPGNNTDRYWSVQAGTLLADGRLLVYIPEEGLEIVAQDGSGEHYPVDGIDKAVADGDFVMISLLQALENNRFIINYTVNGMMVQNTQGGAPVGARPQGAGPQGGVPQGAGPQGGGPQGATRTDGSPVGVGVPFDAEQTAGRPEIQPNTATDPQPVTGPQPAAGPGPATDPQPAAGPGPEPQSGGSYSSSSTFEGVFVSSIEPKTLIYDLATGQIIAELPVDDAISAASDADGLYIMDMNRNVAIFDPGNGTPSGKPDIRFGGADTQGRPGGIGMRFGAQDGNLLAINDKGEIFAALDGSLLIAGTDGTIRTLLESTAYSIGAPRSSINAVLTPGDGSIIINLLDNSRENRLYKYVWDDNASIDPDKTMTVWSLEDNSFARAAIAELRKKHPDSYIAYEVALDQNSAMSAADAIRTLNTRLLSGSGPDVILLDGCPAESYAERGMLLDLSGIVNTGDVYDRLLQPYMNNGNLYYLPTQFLMPMLMGSAEALAAVRTLDDLISLVVNGEDLPVGSGPGPFTAVDEQERPALYFSDLEELCNTLWIACASEIISDNRLDTDALRHYLEAAKAISDKYNLTEETPERMGMSVGFSDGGAVSILPGSLVWYTMQRTNYAAFLADNLQLLQMMMERDGSQLALFPGLTPGAWQPSTIIGVSADTHTPQFAAELIQTMLGVEVQRLNYGTGLPVTRAGISAQIEAINEQRMETGRDAFTLTPDALIGDLTSPSMGDAVLIDMTWPTVERCCKGQLDVEGAVSEIERNIKNYLAERSQ